MEGNGIRTFFLPPQFCRKGKPGGGDEEPKKLASHALFLLSVECLNRTFFEAYEYNVLLHTQMNSSETAKMQGRFWCVRTRNVVYLSSAQFRFLVVFSLSSSLLLYISVTLGASTYDDDDERYELYGTVSHRSASEPRSHKNDVGTCRSTTAVH